MIWAALEIIIAILFFYYRNYFFLFLITIAIILCFKRNTKKVFILSQILLFFFCVYRFTYFNKEIIEENNGEYIVIEVYDNFSILENDNIKYLYYDTTLKKGNQVTIIGKIQLLDDNNAFYSYLNTQKVNYLIEGEVTSNNNYLSFNEQIVESLLKNKDNDNKNILKLVLFNQKDTTNDDFYNYFEIFSISFMLVVSGYHINLIFKIFNKTKFFKYAFTLFYLYLINFSVSSLKAFLYYSIKRINKKAGWILNNFDILSLIMIALLIYDPSYCFNKGFIYSFCFSFILDLLNNTLYIKNKRNSFLKKVIIYLSSIPIILMESYTLNTNSFLASLVFVFPVSFLFVFSFIYLFLDKFYLVYKLYILLLKMLLEFFYEFSFELVLGKPSVVVIILLYLFLLIFVYLYQNKLYKRAYLSICCYLIICIIQYSLPYLDYREMVYFLDVGQGDCSILKVKNSKSVVLIDTGGNKYKDLAEKVIIPFLKSKGINVIEKIVITHDDFDHNGSKDKLIEKFKVNEVIENSLINQISIGESKFINLNINDSRDNDGSIVLYGEYGGIKYLFSADISSKIERKIIDENKDLDVDVLKISHHGSKGSTSEEFLKATSPFIALIGVSKNNSYNHPSFEVIKRLDKFGVRKYLTSEDGTITIYKSLISEEIIIEKE